MKIRTKRRICLAVSLVSFLFVIGAVGSMELGTMSVGRGIATILVGMLAGCAAAYKGGYIK